MCFFSSLPFRPPSGLHLGPREAPSSSVIHYGEQRINLWLSSSSSRGRWWQKRPPLPPCLHQGLSQLSLRILHCLTAQVQLSQILLIRTQHEVGGPRTNIHKNSLLNFYKSVCRLDKHPAKQTWANRHLPLHQRVPPWRRGPGGGSTLILTGPLS